MQLRRVTYDQLSARSHQVFVSDDETSGAHQFLVIQFQGIYKAGAAGSGDALYIVSAIEAARRAWWAPSTVVDFRELEYTWGDEMEWVAEIGWDRVTRIQAPLAIVISDKCRKALKSLLEAEFERVCVDTLESAFELCRAQEMQWHQQLKEWRSNRPTP
jgi:hypothetical protein